MCSFSPDLPTGVLNPHPYHTTAKNMHTVHMQALNRTDPNREDWTNPVLFFSPNFSLVLEAAVGMYPEAGRQGVLEGLHEHRPLLLAHDTHRLKALCRVRCECVWVRAQRRHVWCECARPQKKTAKRKRLRAPGEQGMAATVWPFGKSMKVACTDRSCIWLWRDLARARVTGMR